MTMVLCILHQIYHRQQKLLQRKIPNHRQHIDVSVIQRAKQRSYRHKPATLLYSFLFVYNNIQQFSFLKISIYKRNQYMERIIFSFHKILKIKSHKRFIELDFVPVLQAFLMLRFDPYNLLLRFHHQCRTFMTSTYFSRSAIIRLFFFLSQMIRPSAYFLPII